MTTSVMLVAGAIIVAWLGFTLWCYRHRLFGNSGTRSADAISELDNCEPVVAFASETGQAQLLAESLHKQLTDRLPGAELMPLNRLTPDRMTGSRVYLFASTTGEGDAPDNGEKFVPRLSGVSGLDCEYALLALGDRDYDNFCQFGVSVHQALQQAGARALFEPILMDDLADRDMQAWQAALSELQDGLETDDGLPQALRDRVGDVQTCTLLTRQCLNEGSPGKPIQDIRLQVSGDWQAGDIIRLQLPEALASRSISGPTRDYSIASMPAEGEVRLLLREHELPDGRPGLGSGLLCQQLQPGDSAEFALVKNPNFHAPELSVPLILIGNGTGLAGLRAHLQQRSEQSGDSENWLIFGERSAAHDAIWQDDLSRWSTSGLLSRLDLAFSRDAATTEPLVGHVSQGYVQQVVEQQGAMLKDWVERGAAIYLCGSREGMAHDVDTMLRQVLGADLVDQMDVAGRYRRDVY